MVYKSYTCSCPVRKISTGCWQEDATILSHCKSSVPETTEDGSSIQDIGSPCWMSPSRGRSAYPEVTAELAVQSVLADDEDDIDTECPKRMHDKLISQTINPAHGIDDHASSSHLRMWQETLRSHSSPSVHLQDGWCGGQRTRQSENLKESLVSGQAH